MENAQIECRGSVKFPFTLFDLTHLAYHKTIFSLSGSTCILSVFTFAKLEKKMLSSHQCYIFTVLLHYLTSEKACLTVKSQFLNSL